jgi:hypothetical protein
MSDPLQTVWYVLRAYGSSLLGQGERESEGRYSPLSAPRSKPLTLVLSPSPMEEARKTGACGVMRPA